jgi:hypothetical protein
MEDRHTDAHFQHHTSDGDEVLAVQTRRKGTEADQGGKLWGGDNA